MSVRDVRRQLRGHFLEGDAELIIRDVSAAANCERCGGRLDIGTVPMTGRVVEQCRRCGTSEPVQRFLPMKEHKDVEPPSGPIS